MGALLRVPRLDPTQVPTCPVELAPEYQSAFTWGGLWLPGISGADLSGAGLNIKNSGSVPVGGTAIGPGATTSASGYLTSSNNPALMTSTSDNMTLFAWVLSLGAQNGWASIIGFRAGGAVEIDFDGSPPQLSYTFGATYGWNSGFSLSVGVPTFLALSHTPSAASFYYGTGGSLQNSVHTNADGGSNALSPIVLGLDQTFSARWFNGIIIAGGLIWNPLTPAQISELFYEPFSMLRPIMRRTWFVPASGGATTLVLGARGWDWSGHGPKVDLAAALTAKQWDWEGRPPGASNDVALTGTQWNWAARPPEPSLVVSPAPKPWVWHGIAPALSFPLDLAGRGWQWAAHGIVVAGALTLVLARAVWRWSTRGVPLIGRGAGWLSGVISGTVRGLLAKDKP